MLALAAPGGVSLWVSDVLAGSTHDELVPPDAHPYLKDLPFLADSGYEGADADVLVPVKGRPAASWTRTREPATCSCAPCATGANAALR